MSSNSSIVLAPFSRTLEMKSFTMPAQCNSLPIKFGKGKNSVAGEAKPDRAIAVHDRLFGPVASMTIPFNSDYTIDYGSLRSWIDFMCDQKAPIIFWTYEDGEIDAFSEQEIGEVNRVANECVDGRALYVGATGAWWTGRTIDFIRRMEDIGLEAINVHFSPRLNQEEQLVPAFQEIAQSSGIPLLVYDNEVPVSVVARLAQVPTVVGVKSHADLYGFYDLNRRTREDCFAVIGAGQMKQYLFGCHVDSPGYVCPLSPIAPGVSQLFFDAAQHGEWEKAKQIVVEFEDPLLAQTVPLGYPQAYKSMLHVAGHYSTNLVRSPRCSNLINDLRNLRDFVVKNKLSMP